MRTLACPQLLLAHPHRPYAKFLLCLTDPQIACASLHTSIPVVTLGHHPDTSPMPRGQHKQQPRSLHSHRPQASSAVSSCQRQKSHAPPAAVGSATAAAANVCGLLARASLYHACVPRCVSEMATTRWLSSLPAACGVQEHQALMSVC